jgi:RNA polymerase sigma-70 factor (ECF subfamily)
MLPMELEERIRERLEAADARGAATEAIRGLGPQVLRYLRSMLRDEDAAADAFSLFAENLWRGIGTFQGRSSFKTWALRLAWNASLDVRGDAWRRHGRRFASGEASALADSVRTKSVVRTERQRQALEQLRASLSEEDRCLLLLRVDQGLSWEEVAEVLAADGAAAQPAALMKRFERLKERLGKMARDQGLVE